MSLLLLASAYLTLAQRAPITLTVNAKDGDVVRGERSFRVSVATTGDQIVSAVEFYVNGELRGKDESTPYEFNLDTIGENDGPVKLRFRAYTSENKSGEKTINVKVDNELGKGAAYHVDRANGLLADGKYALARDAGRTALKAEKGNPAARVALARAYMGLGEFDQAQLQAEEANAAKPNDPAVLTLLSGINVQRAFRIYAKPDSDRAEVLKQIKEALAGAVENRRKALDASLDLVKLDPAKPAPYLDAALSARRYGAVISAAQPLYTANQNSAEIADRLAYAYLRTNRPQDAINTLNTLQRAGTLTPYGYALRAVALAEMGDDAASDNAMREAVLGDSENLGVRTAQAFIALKRGKTDVVSKLAADLQKEQGQRADVRYFQMALAAKDQRYSDASRAFQVGVLAEPAMADLYVEYANDAIAITQRGNIDAKEKAQHYAEARAYFETALVARPEAAEALSGLAMVAAFEGKAAEAVKYATAAVAAAPMDAGAHYALAAAQNLARNVAAAQAAMRKADQLDPKYLGGRQIPDAPAVWRYLGTAGRPVVIAAP
ncbi:tetratricopeptide repeat protein [bacterium]|nr:MAG: tetratricopeptide repeat protein [bacterium]